MKNSTDDLREELASLVRVRNRLASTPCSDLPRILAALLPRVLSRVDRNALALADLSCGCKDEDIEEEHKIRKDIQTHQMGMLSHVMERVRAKADMPVPYLETVSSFLRSSCKWKEGGEDFGHDGNGGRTFYSSYGRNFALALIQVGLSHCHNVGDDGKDRRCELVHAVLASALCAVEYFHKVCQNDRNGTDGTITATRGNAADVKKAAVVLYTPLFNASWLVLDCVCILAGVRPLWEECNEEIFKGVRVGFETATSPATKPINDPDIPRILDSGTGVFDLFLEVLLYRPIRSSTSWGRRGWEAGRAPETEWMSLLGTERIHHRMKTLVNTSHSLDIDIMNLKFACLTYAISPIKHHLHRGGSATEMREGLTRALMLLVLTGYGTYTSKVGRAAKSYLDEYINRRKIRKEKKGNFSPVSREICTVSMACSLLILAIGDVAAGPILDQHMDCKNVWECIIGARPLEISRDVNEEPDDGGGNENIDDAMDFDDGIENVGMVGLVNNGGNMDIAEIEHDMNDEVDDNIEGLQNNVANDRENGDTFVSGFARGPLPPNAAASAIDFVTRYLISPDITAPADQMFLKRNLGNIELQLLFDLALHAGENTLGLSTLRGRADEQARQGQVADQTENLVRMLQCGTGATLSAGARIINALSVQLLPFVGPESFTAPASEIGGLVPSWVNVTCRRCLDNATKVLSTVPSLNLTHTGRVWDEEHEQEHRNRPWAAGRAGLIQHHREMRQLTMGPALPEGVRVQFYDMIRSFAGKGVVSLEGEVFSFAIPILLFRCMMKEEVKLQGNIAAALETLLAVYKKLLSQSSNSYESSNKPEVLADFNQQHLAAPLLPPLLSAACSGSHAAKLASVRWSSEIVQLVDPLAAKHLCSFLSDDANRDVAKVAKKGITRCKNILKQVDEPACAVEDSEVSEQTAVVMFLDSSSGMDKEVLYAKLDFEVRNLSNEVNIPESAASILLRHFKFSKTGAMNAIKLDRVGTLHRCGIAARCLSTFATSMEQSKPPGLSPKWACEICFDDDFSLDEMFSLPCGHKFCSCCFKTYIDIQFDENPTAILDCTCPRVGCHEKVTDQEVGKLSPDQLDTWKDQRFVSFIDMEPHHRWCPGPDCKMIGISETASGTAKCVKCDTQFCFECGERTHLPATCVDFERWNKVFSSSKCWIARNSKPCPGCDRPIEKDSGCNHMHCSQCDSHFCWVCLAFIGGYGDLATHLCNEYDPAKHQTQESRDVFYVLRFQAHDEAETFAKQNSTDNINMKWLEDGPLPFSSEEIHIFREATEALVQCRHFLKFSYIMAYSMLDDPKRRIAFEKQQGALEMLTEKLSELTETNLEILRSREGERALRIHLKVMAFHTLSVRKYAERMRKTF